MTPLLYKYNVQFTPHDSPPCGCRWTIWEDADCNAWAQHGDNPEHRRQFSCRLFLDQPDAWEPVRKWIWEVNERCLATKAV